eukprot:38484-Hanusia_phi.AAC.2
MSLKGPDPAHSCPSAAGLQARSPKPGYRTRHAGPRGPGPPAAFTDTPRSPGRGRIGPAAVPARVAAAVYYPGPSVRQELPQYNRVCHPVTDSAAHPSSVCSFQQTRKIVCHQYRLGDLYADSEDHRRAGSRELASRGQIDRGETPPRRPHEPEEFHEREACAEPHCAGTWRKA